MNRTRLIEDLLRLECYAYNRWLRRFSRYWHRLAVACNRAVREHPEYRGAPRDE